MADYTDDELLKLVADERQRSVGFEHDAELLDAREQALRFIKGDMATEVPSLPNRSSTVTSDIQDAILTLMPDLMEIFVGGDDVVAFSPQSKEDEKAAQQETDFIKKVVFQDNPGFLLFYTFIYDALSQKTGVLKYWRETDEEPSEELTGQTALDLHIASLDSEIVDVKPSKEQTGPETVYDATVRQAPRGRICIDSVAPEDFTVAADTTVYLSRTSYCAHRTRVRAQDLIADGVDPDIVAKLPATTLSTSITAQARDTAGESSISQGSGANDDLKIVEVVEHYIRLLEGKELCLYRVKTGNNEGVFIEKAKVNRIPFAAITPYIVTHRFYGQSVSDLLIEPQKVNTALTRMGLDSGFFALNQRVEVADRESNEFTLMDVLQNQPGVPVRSMSGNAVRPIEAGKLGFDVFGALEYFQTKNEARTGIVRNAQGLNPDTLHDTAKGAMALMGAAQKRVRMIARVFAETGIKDLFLGVHALIREDGASHKAESVRLGSEWVPIDPTSWGERSDMTVEVGLGASGRDVEMAQMGIARDLIQQLVLMQGGGPGPLVSLENIYAFSSKFLSKAGIKEPELYLTDPATAQQQQPQAPKPDPEMVKIQSQQQLDQAKLQGEQQLAQQRFAHDQQLAQLKTQTDQAAADRDLQLQREKMQLEDSFKRDQAAQELQLKREEMQLEAQVKIAGAHIGAQASNTIDGPKFGGEPG